MPLDKHHQQVAIGTIYSRLVRRAYTYSAQARVATTAQP
eukprot:SAG11_NODE_33022_length_279_cov_1.144444_1_plen_38_part_01